MNFWFVELKPPSWYVKDPVFDALLTTRFGAQVAAALDNKLNHWGKEDEPRLALILLLDQMTRNIYRDTPKAFAGDAAALALSLLAVADGQLERETDGHRRNFLLMPFMHSEDIEVQNQGLGLFLQYGSEKTIEFAQRHFDIIDRFGRFPHRNAILGRASTEAEEEYLSQPGAGF